MTTLGAGSPEWAAPLGASSFLRKAFDVPALLQKVTRCLEVSR
jgi:hypothetical protein